MAFKKEKLCLLCLCWCNSLDLKLDKYRVLKIVLFVTQIYDSKRIFSFSVKSSVNTVQYVSFFAGRGQQNDYYMRKRREQNAVKCRYDRMQNMSLCSISCEYNIVSKCRSTIQVLKVFQSQNVILGSLSFVSTNRDPWKGGCNRHICFQRWPVYRRIRISGLISQKIHQAI